MRFYKFKQLTRGLSVGITPQDKWKKDSREVVLAEIRKSQVWQHAPIVGHDSSFSKLFHSLFAQAVLKPVIAGVLIFALVSYSSVTTVQAARASLPGDTLYSMKLGIEAAQVGVAFSESKKAELEMSFATTRLHEVSEILLKDAQSDEPTNANAHIAQAIKQFNADLGSVQKRLEKLSSEEKSEETVLKISKLVNEKTDELEENLLVIKEKISETKESVIVASLDSEAIDPVDSSEDTEEKGSEDSPEDVNQDDLDEDGHVLPDSGLGSTTTTTPEILALGSSSTTTVSTVGTSTKQKLASKTESIGLLATLDNALVAVDKTNTKSLEVFVGKASASNSDAAKQDAADKIQKKIEKIEKEVEGVFSKEEATAPTKDTNIPTAKAADSAQPEQEQKSVEEASTEKPQQAQEGINEVKKILESKQSEKLPEAVEKVKAIKAIVNEADKKPENKPSIDSGKDPQSQIPNKDINTNESSSDTADKSSDQEAEDKTAQSSKDAVLEQDEVAELGG